MLLKPPLSSGGWTGHPMTHEGTGDKGATPTLPSALGFPGDSDSEESICNAEDLGLIPGWGISPREGNGYPLQYSCLENPMDRGAWQLQSMGPQRIGHDWATNTFTTFCLRTFLDTAKQLSGKFQNHENLSLNVLNQIKPESTLQGLPGLFKASVIHSHTQKREIISDKKNLIICNNQMPHTNLFRSRQEPEKQFWRTTEKISIGLY